MLLGRICRDHQCDGRAIRFARLHRRGTRVRRRGGAAAPGREVGELGAGILALPRGQEDGGHAGDGPDVPAQQLQRPRDIRHGGHIPCRPHAGDPPTALLAWDRSSPQTRTGGRRRRPPPRAPTFLSDANNNHLVRMKEVVKGLGGAEEDVDGEGGVVPGAAHEAAAAAVGEADGVRLPEDHFDPRAGRRQARGPWTGDRGPGGEAEGDPGHVVRDAAPAMLADRGEGGRMDGRTARWADQTEGPAKSMQGSADRKQVKRKARNELADGPKVPPSPLPLPSPLPPPNPSGTAGGGLDEVVVAALELLEDGLREGPEVEPALNAVPDAARTLRWGGG